MTTELPKPVVGKLADLKRIIDAVMPHAEVAFDSCGQIVIYTNLSVGADDALRCFEVPDGKDHLYGISGEDLKDLPRFTDGCPSCGKPYGIEVEDGEECLECQAG